MPQTSSQAMSNVWEKAGVILGGLSLIAAIVAFATPEIRCFFKLPSESCLSVSKPRLGVGVAIVFDPPSNVRQSPNGKILCSIQKSTTINIYNSVDDWYETDICGTKGVIHSSQITFQPN